MTLSELKNKIVARDPIEGCIIIEDEVGFISYQYSQNIKNYQEMIYIDIDDLPKLNIGIGADDSLYYCRCDNFKGDIKLPPNIIISAVHYEGNGEYIKVEKLKEWQLREYIKTYCKDFNDHDVDCLLSSTNRDIYSLDNEINKIKNLPSADQAQYINYIEVKNHSIFDFTKALVARDYDQINKLYYILEKYKNEPYGIISILHNQFLNLINVWLNNNPTEQNTGLKSNQIYAIKHLKRVFNETQLIKILSLITDLDRKIKTGEQNINNIIDYLIVKILII